MAFYSGHSDIAGDIVVTFPGTNYIYSILLPSGSEEHEVLWTGSIQEGILHATHFR